MKYFQLVEASIVSDVKNDIKNALVALKIQGVEQVQTEQVLKDFADRGSPISYESLVNFIGEDPLVANINQKFITFSGTTEEPEVSNQPKIDTDKLQVQKMANKALDKRI